jgi:hypothetical protein
MNLFAAATAGFSFPHHVLAGMPSYAVTDVAHARLQSISFFLMAFFVSAFCVQRLWNYLQKDFQRLPRLSYSKAVGLVSLWGLLFIVVLTMISGARELMTPGAWKKQGATYTLAQPQQSTAALDQKQRLEALKAALTLYANTHDNRFPAHDFVPEIHEALWQAEGSGKRFVYVGGKSTESPAKPLVYEPASGKDERDRLVLLTNGDIKEMPLNEIYESLGAERRP